MRRALVTNPFSAALLWLSMGLLGSLSTALSATPADPSHGFDGIWLIQKAPTKGLRTVDGGLPPLLPQARMQYEDQLKARANGDISSDQTTWCASAGVPRLMFEPYPFEILVNARQTAFMYEWNRWVRLVDMTGNDLQPLYPLTFGTANGHFEGDVLVVITKGLDKVTFIDHSGLPHSDNLIITEHLRLLSPNMLEDRVRFEDPETYSAPWEAVAIYRRQSYDRLKEDVCLDRIKQGKPAI